MKKLIKLIVLILVLAGLTVGYVLYSNYVAEQEQGNTDISEDTSVEVLKIDESSVVSIEYTYDEEVILLKKAEDKWLWAEDEDFPLDQSYPEYMLYDLSNVIADRLIAENLDNEADFGMDEPKIVVNYETANGEKYVYTIGDYNSTAECYYIKSSASDKIYMTKNSAAEPFVYYILEMADVGSLDEFEAEKVTSVEYTVGGKAYALTTDSSGADFYTEPYNYFYVGGDGIKVAADGVASGEFLNSVEALALGDVVAFKPDAEKLSACGLDENTKLVLKVTYDEDVSAEETDTSVTVTKSNSCSVIVGKGVNEEGEEAYYAMLEGSELLYELSGGKSFFEDLAVDFESKLVCPISSDETVAVKVEVGNVVYFYDIDDIKNSEKLTSVFNGITGLVSVGKSDKEKGEMAARVTFEVNDIDLVLTLFACDENNYIAAFDKADNLLVSKESVDNIIKELQS
ncbi:MAG: DUF4340 domain-containing protein [Clostridia bacterium]|nr:DUF4340 domain-containing protein [Clostridia bacterium]